VDGVIAVNVTTLEGLLAVTGPVEIPEFGVTVDEHNAFELTEQHTRVPFEPAADRKEFVALLADEVLRGVLHPAPGTWSPLVETVQALGDAKDLLIYMPDQEQQDRIEALGWDGRVARKRDHDYLMVVDASINSTKLNAVVEHSADIEVSLQEDGAANTTVTLSYENPLSGWASSRDPDIVDKLMLGGLYGGYVRLLTPGGSRIVSVSDASGEIGLEEIATEGGLAVYGRFFALPADTKATLRFEYITTSVLQRADTGATYRLLLQRQPGWDFESVTFRIDPPPGMRTTAVSIDGKASAAVNFDRVPVDLSQDRVVAVEFEAEG
jgi:hypothetical protein